MLQSIDLKLTGMLVEDVCSRIQYEIIEKFWRKPSTVLLCAEVRFGRRYILLVAQGFLSSNFSNPYFFYACTSCTGCTRIGDHRTIANRNSASTHIMEVFRKFQLKTLRVI